MEIKVDLQISLTAYRPEDKAALLEYLNNEDIANNTLVIPYPYTPQHADEWLELTEKQWAAGNLSNWSIRNHDGQLIGGIGRMQHFGAESHLDEIGYWLGTPFRGQGIMTRAVRTYCKYLFEQEGLVRITATVFPHNPASLRVLEKADFQREGYLRKRYHKNGKYLDGILFAKIKEDA